MAKQDANAVLQDGGPAAVRAAFDAALEATGSSDQDVIGLMDQGLSDAEIEAQIGKDSRVTSATEPENAGFRGNGHDAG